MDKYENFYENIYRKGNDNSTSNLEEHPAYGDIKNFIERFELYDKRCLEIGSSKGFFQDMVRDYSGLDIAKSLSKYYKKPYFIVNSDGSYPFEDNSFDAIWSWDVHEHIPDLNQSLLELRRVLKPGGIILFSPAWQCRTWVAGGYHVRDYGELNIWGKLIKATIPIRDSVIYRSMMIFPKRSYKHLIFILGGRFKEISYKKLKPNYEKFWGSDSDACNSIDPHEAILWFESNGFQCLSHPMHLRGFFVRGGSLIFKKLGRSNS
jgi:SAM-dependent methyltransferase